MSNSDEAPGRYASPPCMAAEVDPTYFDPDYVDPEQARDVARWRKAERQRLRSERDAISVADRAALGEAIGAHLLGFLADRFGSLEGRVFSGYWPIKGEPDLRPALTALHRAGAHVALPLVEVKAAPLVFRRWTPETKMVRGDWNIPVPPPEACCHSHCSRAISACTCSTEMRPPSASVARRVTLAERSRKLPLHDASLDSANRR